MEEKIYLLYNFCNQEDLNTCFEINNITLGKIKLDDIKITDENESLEILKELDNGKLPEKFRPKNYQTHDRSKIIHSSTMSYVYNFLKWINE